MYPPSRLLQQLKTFFCRSRPRVLQSVPARRGQFRGYREENGVAKDSQTETFAALKLEINSWRWKGVSLYIRAGQNLPTTCTEIVAKFHKPPTLIPDSVLTESHLRLRLSPEVTIAMGMMTLRPDAEGLALQSGEMVASHSPRADKMDAYERVLGAAMAGDSTLCAREDYVEEAWRIVEPASPLCQGPRVSGFIARPKLRDL